MDTEKTLLRLSSLFMIIWALYSVYVQEFGYRQYPAIKYAERPVAFIIVVGSVLFVGLFSLFFNLKKDD